MTDHVYLGGVGRYHDSGMTTGPDGKAAVPDDMPANAFWRADLLEAANHLVEVIRSRRPQVAVTYDPHGNYGHPDHIQAHRVLMYASVLAASPSHRPDLGAPWQIRRILWNTHNTDKWVEAYLDREGARAGVVAGAGARRRQLRPGSGADRRADRDRAVAGRVPPGAGLSP